MSIKSRLLFSPLTSGRSLRFSWSHCLLPTILLLSAFFELFQLDGEGYANTYYAASVQSMLTSWHNFLFVSYDSAGFVSVDKPPLGLWLQAASTKLLGFSGFSLLLPQALAGIASVALLYLLVARSFGRPAGLIASLVLALTPISVVVARNNTIDSQLILVLLLAGYFVSLSVETGRLRWLLLCSICIGLGFNIKMLQAYLVVPACFFFYLLGSPIRLRTRLWHLALAALLLLAVSLSWSLFVDLTPASQRPFISDSGTNSELSLILGYNGLGRVLQLFVPHLHTLFLFGIPVDLTLAPGFAPLIGDPGPLRLFNQWIGNQVSWLLPLALFGLLASCSLLYRSRLPRARSALALLFWAIWFTTSALYFSTARFFHLYYLAMLAPPLAALVGLGLAAMWREYRRSGPLWWLLPLSLFMTSLGQALIVQSIIALAISFHANPSWSQWLVPAISGGSLLLACCFTLWHFRSPHSLQSARPLVFLSLLLLLLAPFIWDAFSLLSGSGGLWLPQAGPTQAPSSPPPARSLSPGQFHFSLHPTPKSSSTHSSSPDSPAGALPLSSLGALVIAGPHWNVLDPKLVRYLQLHQGHTTFLAATETSTYASVLILATGQPVMTLGGYQGWDRILSLPQLSHLVAIGAVRFFYLPTDPANPFSQSGPALSLSDQAHPNGDLERWIYSSCSTVDPALWLSSSDPASRSPSLQLYDCSHPAL